MYINWRAVRVVTAVAITVIVMLVTTNDAVAKDREYRDSDRYKGIFNHRIRAAAPQLNWESVDHFLPNSMSDWAVDDSSVLIPEWLAIEKGLENYVD